MAYRNFSLNDLRSLISQARDQFVMAQRYSHAIARLNAYALDFELRDQPCVVDAIAALADAAKSETMVGMNILGVAIELETTKRRTSRPRPRSRAAMR